MASRRRFLKRAGSALGLSWMGYEGTGDFLLGRSDQGRPLAFPGEAPAVLDTFSRPAAFFERVGDMVICRLCPHECNLFDDDRGFCRTRVVKHGAMYTVGYGNLCALALDPIEKKPLYHFLPRSQIVSVAIGGCNLRCPNCQNWEISQATPEEVRRFELTPEQLVRTARDRSAPSIAYTYTEPLIYYEFVRDTAAIARAAGVNNVLVTAGYANETPMRELCASIDAVQLDVKAFDERTYQRVNGARLAPVLRNLEIIRQEGVWLEVSFLMVTDVTDEPKAVGDFARWIVAHLGADTPLHLLRFHPAHKTTHLAPTPVSLLRQAQDRARDAGLHYVYLGNVPGLGAGTTLCPHDGEVLIERRGYHVVRDRLTHGACPKCGNRIAGVFEG